MWVFTKRGFISAVQNMDDPTGETLILRSRAQGDLRAFREKYMGENAKNQITYHSQNDYPFRMVVTRDEYKAALIASVDEIDYKNFKNAVADNPEQGYERANIYNRIWGVMLKVEGDLRKRRFKADSTPSSDHSTHRPYRPMHDESLIRESVQPSLFRNQQRRLPLNEGPKQQPPDTRDDSKRDDDEGGIKWPVST